jgi:ribonuclease VapC
MMVVDSSALIELVIAGPQAAAVQRALAASTSERVVSAANWLEVHIVLRRRFGGVYDRAAGEVATLMGAFAVNIAPVSLGQAEIAIGAFKRFGQGAGGGALNFGDCFAYALARDRNDDLLLIGADFAKTDVRAARL